MKTKIVCLCGSTRFMKEFEMANLTETLKGNIVLSIGCNLRNNKHCTVIVDNKLENVKENLDFLHKEKIKLADEVFIINVNGYIGNSTKSEIDYAKKLNKKIRYLEG